MSAKSRAWCLTLNNWTEEEKQALLDSQCKYVILGEEIAPDTGTPHLQGYIYFQNAVRLTTLRNISPRAHFEAARGTPAEAILYCEKEGTFTERGTRPMTQVQKGDKGKQTIEERWELAKKGEFESLAPENIKTYEYIYRKYKAVEDRTELDNVWIWGPSGCGKSRYVRDTFPEGFYTKPMSKWWDGYDHEEVVLLDDFDPSHGKYLAYFLKIWADHYAFNAEVKGGMLSIRPKKIIVTSQYPIDACFEDAEAISAITRRFRIVDMRPVPTAIAETFNVI